MNNIVLKNGIFGGLVVSAFMVCVTIYMKSNPNQEPSMILGFASMILAFFFVVWGIKQHRELNGGVISLGKAFVTGLLISLIISTIYVLVWLVILYNFFPNFMDHYAEMAIKNANPEEVEKVTSEMNTYKEMYKSPIMVILLTYMEILPLGIVVSFLSALILKKKQLN